ncbi:hypothetical protein [Staphylococcus pettenkoferi]|uniref:hypothetical protein n=1 Tax=Staphylococcus pettenkoferi TaxID=170573 RepID=UPI002275D206|nr:hypothetical protein [Staphylococcus pettenkoferi]MCY1565533.1 hypothetical protein [Staphylococcus pettenkoferi]MCY1589889.1 hypothetical protein [Staphylococcus pettenkoferi]MCY1599279.1 hypothetical protein [Staphylococcus pettenkoferi]MCY1602874.1 hypothetical protein [Staphylococcus pettenkoferi]MCY1613747.1 hypothetical protein [Staphylococcus pettenkoferi]
MQEQNKKVIYYYYDESGNRRLMFESNNLIDSYEFLYTKFPETKNNLYALIQGKEFKLA